jgi:hypothetical protein
LRQRTAELACSVEELRALGEVSQTLFAISYYLAIFR